jgi:hypothetical protein
MYVTMYDLPLKEKGGDERRDGGASDLRWPHLGAVDGARQEGPLSDIS